MSMHNMFFTKCISFNNKVMEYTHFDINTEHIFEDDFPKKSTRDQNCIK